MEYAILSEANQAALELRTNEYIKKGWRPRGMLLVVPNPHCVTKETQYLYIQPMILEV